jgi:hypothetical protein
MLFNQRLVKGDLSKDEYIAHLTQQLAIFDTIEVRELPHPSLKRSNKIVEDIKELFGNEIIQITILSSTKEYTKYLDTLTQEQLLPHIYLNYLAIQKDEWADEVNTGFDYIIKIYDELQKYP